MGTGQQTTSGAPAWVVRLIDVLIKYRLVCLIIAGLATAVAWSPSSQLSFEQSIEALYSRDNPRLQDYLASKPVFGGDEFVILAYKDPDLFAQGEQTKLTGGATRRIESLAEQLADLPGIDPASIQHMAYALRFPYARDRVRNLLEGVLVGEDDQTVAIISRLKPATATDAPPRAETFRRVREIADLQLLKTVVVGEPVQVHEMFRYVEEDGQTLSLASTAMLMTVIVLLFRSLRWMILPALVVQATLLWTRAILVVSGLQLSMVSSMLNSLVTVIGVATVMYITLKFRDLAPLSDRVTALRQTLCILAVPIFWMATTTATGFCSLLVSHIAPVVDFGLMMALASLLMLVAVMLIVPAGVLIGPHTQLPATPPGEEFVTRLLLRQMRLVQRAPIIVGVTMLTITAVCSFGLFLIHVETDFSKNFRPETPIVQALDFFEANLGGAGTWEVNFPAPSKLTDEYLDKVRALTRDLQHLTERDTPDRITKVISLSDGIDILPERILFTRLSLQARLDLLETLQSDFVTSLYNPAAGRMRIMLRSLERQPADAKLQLIADVQTIGQKHFPDARTTGLFVLLSNLIESLLNDQTTASVLSALAVLVQMTIAFRGLRVGIASLLPNVFPITIVLGVMGLLGVKVNIGTAMIACVSLGLTVDSSVHYIDSFLQARRKGLSRDQALEATQRSVGLAVVFSNLALVAGFSVLTLSNFLPLVEFGVLFCASMIGGLIGNLVILPLIMHWVDPTPTSTIIAGDFPEIPAETTPSPAT